jgi:hypothetical protein
MQGLYRDGDMSPIGHGLEAGVPSVGSAFSASTLLQPHLNSSSPIFLAPRSMHSFRLAVLSGRLTDKCDERDRQNYA